MLLALQQCRALPNPADALMADIAEEMNVQPCQVQKCKPVRPAVSHSHSVAGLFLAQVCKEPPASTTVGSIEAPAVVLVPGRHGSVELCGPDLECLAANEKCKAMVKREQKRVDSKLADFVEDYTPAGSRHTRAWPSPLSPLLPTPP